MNTQAELVRGVDGCPAGWIAVTIAAAGPIVPCVTITRHFAELIRDAEKIAVDMPIGLPEAVGRKALDPVPVETIADAKNFSLDDNRKDRFSTKMLIESRRDAAATVRNPSTEKDYSLDLASSYSLTRNLNVTAGVRYNNSVAGRLTPMTDDRQDSQAVYLGTIFKF